MVRRCLITTADERTWPVNKPVVFLGEWCKKYSRKHVWQARISQMVNYHWRDREKLAIENEIDEAELDNKQRQKISTMAMRALERQRKS